jgi:hypothetical protein
LSIRTPLIDRWADCDSGCRRPQCADPRARVAQGHSGTLAQATLLGQNGFFAFGGAINAHGGSVSGNSGFGATAYPGGYLDLADGIDVSHNRVGVSSSGGRILIQNGGIVENSSSDGVQASGASSVVVEDGTIQSNGGDGIHVMDNSVVDLNPNDVITGNTGGDVMCDSTPANPLLTGQTPSNISTNCRHA